MAHDYSKSAMIALTPSEESAKLLAVENGLPAEDLHLTVLYLGDTENYPEQLETDLLVRFSDAADRMYQFFGKAFAVDFFNLNDEEKSCIVLGISSPELDDIRNVVNEEVQYISQIIPEQHRPWVPHMTLTYNVDDYNPKDLTGRLGLVHFDRLVLKFGDFATYFELNRREEGMSSTKMNYLVDLSKPSSFSDAEDGNGKWIHALPIGNYNHPKYGKIVVTADRVKKFASSVVNRVRGIDPSVNYNHKNEEPAAGWVKNAEARPDGLWLFVEWVSDALQAIKDKKYRYFSAEYADVWENTDGKEFEDVIIGGALTNRPFMKNLTPINLSEATYDNAFDLVSYVTGKDVESLKGGESMELSEDQLTKIIEGVASKLEKKGGGSGEKKPEATLNLTEVAELKALAEENPLVAALINKVETQGVDIVSTQRELTESRIARQLAEFDKSKLVLTPVAKKLVYKLLSEMPETQHDEFWELMTHMRKSQSFLVDLSERAGVAVKYGVDRSPSKRFNDLVNKELAKGVAYADAVTKVASEDPNLYEEYRQESFSFKA